MVRSSLWPLVSLSFLWSTFPVLEGHEERSKSSGVFDHFQFRSGRVGGRKVAVVSLKLDPDRGRRSLFVPDSKGHLHAVSFGSLDGPDESLGSSGLSEVFFVEDATNDVDRNVSSFPQTRHSLKTLDVPDASEERDAERRLNDVEASLIGLEKKLIMEITDQERDRDRVKSKTENTRDRVQSKTEKKRDRERKKQRKGSRKNKMSRKNKKNKSPFRIKGPKIKMYGQEACQYRILLRCARRTHLSTRSADVDSKDLKKCDQRTTFLECVEKRRKRRKCRSKSLARGNLPKLRSFIRKFFWSANSCLLINI